MTTDPWASHAAPTVPEQRPASEPRQPAPSPQPVVVDEAFTRGYSIVKKPHPEPARPQGLPGNAVWDTDDGCWRVKSGWYRGWYLAPGYDPDSPETHDGKWEPRQRVTTFIKKAEGGGDSFGLTEYSLRTAISAVLTNPALLGEFMPLAIEHKHKQFLTQEDYQEQNRTWRPLLALAHDMGGGNIGSKNGDAIHYVTEQLDTGHWTLQDVADLHPRWLKHAEAYLALRDANFEVRREWVERVIDPSPWGPDGKFDRIVMYQAPDSLIDAINAIRSGWVNTETGEVGLPVLPYETEPRPTVLDIKSGDVEYDRDKFGRQMLIYSHARAVMNFETSTYEPLPENLNRDFCLVVAIPWWDEEPVASLLPVPYLGASGKEGLDAAAMVRDLPKTPKLRPVATATAPQYEVGDLVTVELPEGVTTEPIIEATVTKPRKCGNCGEVGHTKRSCPAEAGQALAEWREPAQPVPSTVIEFPEASVPLTWEQRIAACRSMEELKLVRADARVEMTDEEWKEKYYPLASAQRTVINEEGAA